jgi:putative SOS response-associated peptidase YedK
MCGRATLSTSPQDLRDLFGLDDVPELRPRFNIAPTQPIAVIREPHRLELIRWGLILPGDHRRGAQGINVRVESVARAPAYRESFRRRRCLVIVDGFFEWEKRDNVKQPFIVRREDRKPFALAGIWERSATTDGEIIDSCAVVTGDAKGVVAEVHDRMPLIVPAVGYTRWLDPGEKQLADLLVPTAEALVSYPVSTLVNSPANDDPRCVEPVAAEGEMNVSLRLF